MRPWTHRRADSTQAPIFEALRACGATVYAVNAIGQAGFPDAVIGFAGVTALGEIKTKKGAVRKTQKEFMLNWRGGPVFVLREPADAATVLQAMVKWK